MSIESSIQIVYQMALMFRVYILNDIHSLEIKSSPLIGQLQSSHIWKFTVFLRLLGTLSSGYTAFAATVKSADFVSIHRDGKPLGALKTFLKVTENFVAILLHSLVVFLVMTFLNSDERWKNYREMLRADVLTDHQYAFTIGIILFLVFPAIVVKKR